MSAPATLPRNSTRQAEGLLYGRVTRLLNRFSGIVIAGFVLIHVVVQATLSAGFLDGSSAATQWLIEVQDHALIHALLYFSLVFHTIWGIKLFLGDLGYNVGYQRALWIALVPAILIALWELSRYVVG